MQCVQGGRLFGPIWSNIGSHDQHDPALTYSRRELMRGEGNCQGGGVCTGGTQVEDLLEYYMQRAATLQSESERLLAGARDLEESIGVSLSARRFEARLSHLAHL